MTIDQFREIRSKAGGLVIMLLDDLSSISLEEKQHIFMLEQAMMAQEISIPVYFTKFDKEMNQIIEDSAKNPNSRDVNKKRDSALSEILGSISANGYQAVISGASHVVNKQSKIPIIQGELAPMKNKNTEADSKVPLIIITAHLDTFGLINDHLANLDVAVLLTLSDLFSKLHNSVNTSPKYRLLFLVSESGSFLNFQGMKKWLDTNVDENVQIQNAEFVICLDSIVQQIRSNTIFMHVSKPPKDGTKMNNFYKQLKQTASLYGNVSVEGVHKKINLADIVLAWEHERFSMKRMPAFTLSSLKVRSFLIFFFVIFKKNLYFNLFQSHKDSLRTTVFKESESERVELVQKSAKILAEALASYMYDINNGEIFTNSMVSLIS